MVVHLVLDMQAVQSVESTMLSCDDVKTVSTDHLYSGKSNRGEDSTIANKTCLPVTCVTDQQTDACNGLSYDHSSGVNNDKLNASFGLDLSWCKELSDTDMVS